MRPIKTILSRFCFPMQVQVFGPPPPPLRVRLVSCSNRQVAMTTTRRFCADDLFRLGPTNMDALTETVRAHEVPALWSANNACSQQPRPSLRRFPPVPFAASLRAVQHGILPVVPDAVARHADSAGEPERAADGVLCVYLGSGRANLSGLLRETKLRARSRTLRAFEPDCRTPLAARPLRHRQGGGQAQQLARPRVRAHRRARVSADGPRADVHVRAGARVGPLVRGTSAEWRRNSTRATTLPRAQQPAPRRARPACARTCPIPFVATRRTSWTCSCGARTPSRSACTPRSGTRCIGACRRGGWPDAREGRRAAARRGPWGAPHPTLLGPPRDASRSPAGASWGTIRAPRTRSTCARRAPEILRARPWCRCGDPSRRTSC